MTDREIVRLYVEEYTPIYSIAKMRACRASEIREILVRNGAVIRRSGPLSGPLHPGWKGGTTIDKTGYILEWAPKHPDANVAGYVRQHRLVMEKKLGRQLTKKEVVHHIDGDHANNNPANLEVYESNSEHLAAELKGRCPKWTKDGKARMQAAADRKKKLPQTRSVLSGLLAVMSRKQICEAYGVHRGTLDNTISRLGIKVGAFRTAQLLPQGDGQLAELCRKHPVQKIADAYGISFQVVYDEMKRRGVKPGRRQKKRAGSCR